ncbi:MAG: cytochrome b/b6 domain-containing protein [Campylobacterales bacterium]|nr:cytochrome b/b6 domain-containing protein [Campylobacterales bacterium]
MTKSYIWPVANRVAHVLLILFFATSYILGDFDTLLSYHAAFGLMLGIVMLFRVFWGIIGPKYSNFRDFNFTLRALKEYLTSAFVKTKEYVGHNPASSYAIVLMIVLTFFTVITGLLVYGAEENHGILSFLHSSPFAKMKIFKESHEFFANVLLGVIVLHVSGALIDKFIKKNDGIDAMLHGYKKTQEPVHVKTTVVQKLWGIVWIVCTLFALYSLLFDKNNIFIAHANQSKVYASTKTFQALHVSQKGSL